MDIVERLRKDHSDERLEIAANEIERLREENKQYLECLTLMAKAALTVLKPKESE